MTGNEFVRKVKNVGHKKGVIVERLRKRGKGSHSTLYYGMAKNALLSPILRVNLKVAL
jgi:mRNA interferase HicA